MKFLIAGYGSIGRRHMRNLLELGERDIVLYRTGRSTLPTDELQGFTVETDLGKALAHKPDAVIVANPSASHLDVAIPAALAGCHLMLEKPVSNTLERLGELRAALRQGGGKALVGFQFRYHPGLRQVKAWCQEGALGRPLSLRCEWGEFLPGWHPWEDYRQSYAAREDLGGGVALTLCHPLDYLSWMFGAVERMWGFSGKISDLELAVDDVSEVGLQFAEGPLASLHLDYYRRPGVHRLEICGTEGMITWDNADGAAHLIRPDGVTQVFTPPSGFERNWLFLDQTRHFIDVARGAAEPVCTLDDGIYAQRLAMAVKQLGPGGLIDLKTMEDAA